MSFQSGIAQDTTAITFSQMPDTLIRQRFIDRYENVFMTKIQTRHMVRFGLSQYYQAVPYPLSDDKTLNNISLNLGYEFKFLPAFSLALSGHLPLYGVTTPVKEAFQNTVMDAQLRWLKKSPYFLSSPDTISCKNASSAREKVETDYQVGMRALIQNITITKANTLIQEAKT